METLWHDMVAFLALPLAMSLILSGIHCYLGFHVLERGIIFVDLSLAQVAAFGAALSLLFGLETGSISSYAISFVCTLFAALLFTRAKDFEKKVPLEAIIGITYALGAACVILIGSSLAHGSEHIKNLLVGQVLWVTSSDVLIVAAIYALVGFIHYFYRQRFFEASSGTIKENKALWDFFFYALFGVVITSSVHVAGVLQVFAYLIVPPVVAHLFFTTLKHKLLFGWSFSFLVSMLGMALSYLFDLPSGAAMVALFTAIPVFLIAFLKKPLNLKG